jgi:hypothetical protein
MPQYRLKLYTYHFVDGKFAFKPFAIYARQLNIPDREAQNFRSTMLAEFGSIGWEGDGELGAGFVPANTLCNAKPGTMYHVKQENNGTSFIASVQSLQSDGLDEVEFHGLSKLYALMKREPPKSQRS